MVIDVRDTDIIISYRTIDKGEGEGSLVVEMSHSDVFDITTVIVLAMKQDVLFRHAVDMAVDLFKSTVVQAMLKQEGL